MTNNNLISTTDYNGLGVYAWFDNGTIYWWSESQIVYVNTSDMSYMFKGLTALTSLDLSQFDGSNSTRELNETFYNCSSLKYFPSNTDWEKKITNKIELLNSSIFLLYKLNHISRYSHFQTYL